MPITVYVDGSGIHADLTFRHFRHLPWTETDRPFNRDWNETADPRRFRTAGSRLVRLGAQPAGAVPRPVHLASISFMTVRHLAYRCTGAPDFKPRRRTWSSSGRLLRYYRDRVHGIDSELGIESREATSTRYGPSDYYFGGWACDGAAASPGESRSRLLQGTVEDGLTIYRGIPFAAPPVATSVRPTQPAAKWEERGKPRCFARSRSLGRSPAAVDRGPP